MLEIKNGDIFDIGQTVNGISKFLWFNNKWYYFNEIMSYEYQYPQEDWYWFNSREEAKAFYGIVEEEIPQEENNTEL